MPASLAQSTDAGHHLPVTSPLMTAPRDIATALTFLTRLPVARFASGEPAALSRATTWFPLVGLLIGSALGLAVIGLSSLLPPSVAVIAVLVLGVVLTGGFHEDGLADVADSAGAFALDSKLSIMRDSRVGTYGALALILLLLARYAVLGDLVWTDWTLVLGALIAAHVLARWSSVLLMTWLPYARAEAANKVVAQGVTSTQLLLSSAVVAVCLIPVAVLEWPLAVLAVPVALAVTALAGLWFRRSFGGITGDCLGAANVLIEISILLTALTLHVSSL